MNYIENLNKQARWLMDSPFPLTSEQYQVLLRLKGVMDENTLILFDIFNIEHPSYSQEQNAE